MDITLGEILKRERIRSGKTVGEVSEFMISKGFKAGKNTIYNWENNNSQPAPDALLTLCSIYGVSNVLATFGYDATQTPALTHTAQRIGRAYEAATPPVQRTVEVALEPFMPNGDTPIKKAPSGEDAEIAGELIDLEEIRVRMRPLSLLPASAGTGVFLDENSYTDVPIGPDVPDCADFGVRISGNSMGPDYPDGHIAWIETAVNLRIGEVGLFVYDGAGYIKELGDGELISYNPEYPPIPLREGLRLDVSGRVVAVTPK